MNEWHNKFTEECDKYAHPKMFSTYFWGNERGVFINDKGWVSFRFPGATRGGVLLENGVIVRIHFDEECFDDCIGCYERDVVEATKCFIGTEFDLPVESW